ncbi:alkaline shock response membrane anchor protein AmaP [Streptomyces sp. NPDC051104]|uniref:alkaline shock response membrane anchor protein AmaP n=1 Tax=Streptomyces sp. NPDC051104 TaxID=3155044 RepID=UPI00343BFE05
MKPQSALTRLNRTLLAVVGLALLGGGLLVLFAGLDLYRRWHLTPPVGWPLTSPGNVLLSAADRTRWSSQGWWWPTAIAALTIATALALSWLIAQLRRPRPRAIPVGGTPPAEGVELRNRALSDVITAEMHSLPGVKKAQARMTGRPQHPHNRIDLTLTPHGAPSRVLHEFCDGPLPNARRSIGTDQFPTEVRLRVARHKPHRAE